jgi:hypothetical protein
LEYFIATWYIFWLFGGFFTVLVSFRKKNLATQFVTTKKLRKETNTGTVDSVTGSGGISQNKLPKLIQRGAKF